MCSRCGNLRTADKGRRFTTSGRRWCTSRKNLWNG
nr:MAG TPA: hypothetical protein [Caudoviricetes sp.]